MGACIVKQSGGLPESIDEPSVTVRECDLPRKEVKEGGIGTSQFILDKTGKIQDVYTMEKKKLGEGTYGSVVRGTHKATGKVRAIKMIAKTQMRNVERFKKEIAIMKMMDHPSIIKLFETFEDSRFIYLAMELCVGGELFDKIISAGHFTEADAAKVMQQILRAVFYMHEHSICHRDLKPENFLFLTKDAISKNVLKLIDFGLSCRYSPNELMATKAGTPYYVAPQVLLGKYTHACDIWSCGVIMYILLCGYPPFYGQGDAEVLAKVRLGHVSFDARDWGHVSQQAKDLIRLMLRVNPKDRLTAEQALNHIWTKRKAPSGNVPLQQGLLDNLRSFRSQNKLMKAALHIIAGQLSEHQIKNLRETFIKLDGNGDGLLTLRELAEGLRQAGLEELPPDMQDIMEGVDSDGSGVIDYTEFVAASLERRLYLQEDVCWCAFKVFDLNSDGMITLDELKKVLNDEDVEEAVGVQTTREILKEIDRNGDGSIDFQEFMSMMQGTKPAMEKTQTGKSDMS
mmetsp:Transcript_81879/g.258279  ORF Transcript_81879/g.258279 Transcript_81879/m.258279 type:complete len:513 (-) Transcript_81879:40-1578(-)